MVASVNLSLNDGGYSTLWDVQHWVTENRSDGNYRNITLYIGVRTKDVTFSRAGGWSVDCDAGGDITETICDVPGSEGDYFEVYKKSFDVYVEPGKTYSDMFLWFEIHFATTAPGGRRSLEGTITRVSGLSLISDVKITSTKNIYFGEKCLVTWTPASNSFHYKLKFRLGNKDLMTTGVISPNTTNSYSYSGYSVPLEEASNIKNSESGLVSVTLYQYSNSSCTEQIGTAGTSSFRVTLSSDVIPKINSCSATINNDANSAIKNWGVAIAGYSAVNIAASASGVYGSDIVSYSITSGYTANVYNSEPNIDLNYKGAVINSSGNKVFTITCTDSRGRVSNPVTTDTILFLSYTMPRINSVTAEKDDRGTDGISDDRMVVTATWEIDSVDSRNSASAVVYYKETSAVDWTLHSGNLTNGSPFTLENLHLDGNNEFKSYNFRVVVTDSVGNSSSKESFAASTKVLLDFKAGGDGLGIGGVCSGPGLEVSMDATFFKEIYISGKQQTLADYIKAQFPQSVLVDMIYPVGSIYISMNSQSPTILFGGTWEKLEGRFLLGAGSFNSNTDLHYGDLHNTSKVFTVGDRGGQDYHKLTVSEMPVHSHDFYGHRIEGPTGYSGWHADYNAGIGNENYIASSGGDDVHNNMPPYLVVNMWRRIS